MITRAIVPNFLAEYTTISCPVKRSSDLQTFTPLSIWPDSLAPLWFQSHNRNYKVCAPASFALSVSFRALYRSRYVLEVRVHDEQSLNVFVVALLKDAHIFVRQDHSLCCSDRVVFNVPQYCVDGLLHFDLEVAVGTHYAWRFATRFARIIQIRLDIHSVFLSL